MAFASMKSMYAKLHKYGLLVGVREQLSTVADVCMKRMCDSRWEVRDTAVQFVADMVNNLAS